MEMSGQQIQQMGGKLWQLAVERCFAESSLACRSRGREVFKKKKNLPVLYFGGLSPLQQKPDVKCAKNFPAFIPVKVELRLN